MGSLLRFPGPRREDGAGTGGPGEVYSPNGVERRAVADGPVCVWIEKYVRGRSARREVTPHTARKTRYTLLDFAVCFGRRPVERMGRVDVERWVESLVARQRKPGTVRLYLSVLKRFARWLVREKVVKRDPCADVRPVHVPRAVPVVFTQAEASAILAVCPDTRARLVVLLTVQCGLRCIEISRLEMGDVGPHWVRVIGKGRKERTVYMPTEARVALSDYLAERGSFAGPLVLRHDRPEPLKAETISALYRRWSTEAGVKRRPWDGKGAHCGRRTCATDLLENGATEGQAAEYLGHEDLASILRYVRITVPAKVVEGRWYGETRLEEAV